MADLTAANRDVVVVGGGPAGLTAALELARGGLSVTVVDEHFELGGQYFRRPAPAVVARWGEHRPEGAALIAAVRSAGVEIRTSTVVWGVDDDGHSLLTESDRTSKARLRGQYLVLATGAHERVLPFPGWQLPGVTTVGFAQHLAACDRTPIGARVLLAGSGPFLLPVACSLLELGVKVLGIAEAGDPYRLSLRSVEAVRFPARMRELVGYAATLARHRVPIWSSRVVQRADGNDRVASVTLARTGDPQTAISTLSVDALCVGYGFRAQTELPRLLGCAMRSDPRSGDLIPVLDATGRASRSDVYVVGEAAGIGGVHSARVEASLAATAILNREGHSTVPSGSNVRKKRRVDRFISYADSRFPAPAKLAAQLLPLVPDDTQICRCEAVTAGEIRVAAVRNSGDTNAVKGSTRAGMGPCQGRECGAAVTVLCGRHVPQGPTSVTTGAKSFTARMPLRPISLESVITLDDANAGMTS